LLLIEDRLGLLRLRVVREIEVRGQRAAEKDPRCPEPEDEDDRPDPDGPPRVGLLALASVSGLIFI